MTYNKNLLVSRLSVLVAKSRKEKERVSAFQIGTVADSAVVGSCVDGWDDGWTGASVTPAWRQARGRK